MQNKGQNREESSPRSTQRPLISRPFLHVFLIGIISLIAYSNTFHSPFQWDETDFLVGNPIVRDLGFFAHPSRAAGLPLYDALKLRYIGYFTFSLNYKLHGFNVFGYHAANLAIHIVNALLVYLLMLFTFRTPFFSNRQRANRRENTTETPYPPYISLALALVFAAHPIQTEAVTYIFQRLASLVSMFYLGSLVLYIKGRLEAMGNRQWATDKTGVPLSYRLLPATYYFFALVFAVCAMKTKENAFTLPVVITLYEFLFFTGPLKRRIVRLVPFYLTMTIVPATLIGAGSTAGEVISQIKDPTVFGYEKMSGSVYLLTEFRVIVTYVRLLFWPVHQNLGYDYPVYRSFFQPQVFISAIFLAALFGIAVYSIRKSRGQSPKSTEHSGLYVVNGTPRAFYYRLFGFGVLWFFITLSVESSLISIPMVIDEYRVYLPSVGFFIAITAALLLFLNRFRAQDGRPEHGNVVLWVCVVLVVVLTSATYARNNLWKEKISMWEDVVRKSPASASAHNNLGMAYKETGQTDRAIEQYKIALELLPDFPLAHMNLGNALDVKGSLDNAVSEYETAVRLAPDNWLTHLNLGNAYGKKGWTDRAIEQLEAALKLNPFSSAAQNGLGNSYAQKRDTARAIDCYLAALRLDPENADAHFNIGATYEEKGDLTAALEHYREAVRLKPDSVSAHYNLGGVYSRTGHLDDAIEEVRAAVRLSPENGALLNTLGVLYGQKGLYEEAIAQFDAAIRRAPENQAFRQNLEMAHRLRDKK